MSSDNYVQHFLIIPMSFRYLVFYFYAALLIHVSLLKCMMAFRLFMPTIFIPPNRCCIYYVKTTHIRSISIFPKAFTMSVWISVKAPGNFKRFRLCSLKMKILVLGQYLPRENILCCTILEWSPAASSRTEIIWKV